MAMTANAEFSTKDSYKEKSCFAILKKKAIKSFLCTMPLGLTDQISKKFGIKKKKEHWRIAACLHDSAPMKLKKSCRLCLDGLFAAKVSSFLD
jgi:hypothetical protein